LALRCLLQGVRGAAEVPSKGIGPAGRRVRLTQGPWSRLNSGWGGLGPQGYPTSPASSRNQPRMVGAVGPCPPAPRWAPNDAPALPSEGLRPGHPVPRPVQGPPGDGPACPAPPTMLGRERARAVAILTSAHYQPTSSLPPLESKPMVCLFCARQQVDTNHWGNRKGAPCALLLFSQSK